MIGVYDKEILARIVRGEPYWGRMNTRPHSAARAFKDAGLLSILEFPQRVAGDATRGDFVAFPPHMDWDYRNHKPVLSKGQAALPLNPTEEHTA